MLSIDILLEWRESFRRGVPLSTMIEAKIALFINTNSAHRKCMRRHYSSQINQLDSSSSGIVAKCFLQYMTYYFEFK